MRLAVRLLPGLLVTVLSVGAAPAIGIEKKGGTALEEYVHTPDRAYEFRLHGDRQLTGLRLLLVEMTSQRWRKPEEVNRTLWKHWMRVYVPGDVRHRTAFLFITGGSNGDPPPRDSDERLARMAHETGSVVAELRQVPNQPLVFPDQPRRKRYEDAIIAHNWKHYLETSDPAWLTRFPMTKAAVRAMDTVTALLAGATPIDRFFVAGGSKRGWTTWTTAAVDSRVVGAAPLVIDLLNIQPSFVHHYRAYGFWAPAIKDYFEMGLMDSLPGRRFEALLRETGPYTFRERYTMPKFLIHSASDQFFLPDSWQFYFDDLPGEKYLRYVPNSDHSLKNSDAFESLVAYYHAVIEGHPRPEFSWRFLDEGTLRVETKQQPLAVKLWTATNSHHRDFRFESVGPIYQSRDLSPQAEGVYVARVAEPPEGWTAYFVELTFPSALEKYPFRFTSGVKVIPLTYPYGQPEPGRTRLGPRKQ